jgi:ATP-dependent DNA helicase RecG
MLDTDVSEVFRLQEPQKRALNRLSIHTVRDLLYHFPARYERAGDQKTIAGLEAGTDAIVYGTVRKPATRKTWKSRRPIAEAWLEDGSGKIKLMWFNQPYIAKLIEDGAMVKVSGRVGAGKSSTYIANPEIERVSELPIGGADTVFGPGTSEDDLFAVYSESKGITSRWFRHAIAKVLTPEHLDAFVDPIPNDVVEKYNLPALRTALVWMHQPKRPQDAVAARKRFAFEEVFTIQVAKQRERAEHDTEPTLVIDGAEAAKTFISRLPFPLTAGQLHAVDAIVNDMGRPPAMSRLLEGDVGSGKTAVAAASAYGVVTSAPKNRPSATLQVAYMAPTEILAEQHFQSFIQLFGHLPIQIGLITGTVCKKFPSKVNPSGATKISKPQFLKWVANGEIAIVIGTHALIQKNVRFRDLAYVIIDEQHRFGTNQRATLARKDKLAPHLLSMTATPIPRTLALTLYGDLDLTVLDEMPPGRKPVITEVVPKSGRDRMYSAVCRELDAGRQAYVICPRIDDPDPSKVAAIQAKSVRSEAARLRMKELKGYRVGILHGQMKPAEKEEAMRKMLRHEYDVLVATSVVEVGVNIPNATSIIIEGAERFGLAQLHQLRGRVVRSTHQAYCYVLTSEGGTSARLKALATAKNGFELAEMDLKLRGPGELYGRSQSGLTDLGMEALKNLKMVEAARAEAVRIVHEDATLSAYPALQEAVAVRKERLHFE